MLVFPLDTCCCWLTNLRDILAYVCRPEALAGLRPETDAAIKAALHMCLTETDLGLGKRTVVCG